MKRSKIPAMEGTEAVCWYEVFDPRLGRMIGMTWAATDVDRFINRHPPTMRFHVTFRIAGFICTEFHVRSRYGDVPEWRPA